MTVEERILELEKRVSELERKRRKAPKPPPDEVTNPFSDHFLATWELWKKYKKEQHNFSYKGVISEQAAINDLVKLSSGDELVAMAIVKQSIEKGWKGFFELKNNQHGAVPNRNSQTNRTSADVLKQKLHERFA